MVQSSNSLALPHLQNIVNSTIGIVYLGTPHAGSDLAKWGAIASNFVGLFRHLNDEIVKSLRPDSQVLHESQLFFGQILQHRSQNNKHIQITCFHESLPVKGLGQV
jgi:hypothetical protein